MLGTVTGNSSGGDLASFRREVSERLCFLVVDGQSAVGAEPAYFPSVERASYLASTCGSIESFSHGLTFFSIFVG